jgi:hypothetical protein
VSDVEERFVSHAEAEYVLRRTGLSQQQVSDLLRKFPDPIDLERDGEALFHEYGISRDWLRDQMGGSP